MSPILYRHQTAKTVILWSATAAVIVFLLRNPALTAASCYRGLQILGKSVLPATFPYMIAAGLLGSSIGTGGKAGRRGSCRLPSCALPVVLLGLLTGFPSSAKLLTDLYRRGALTEKQASRLLACCNFCSPPFLVTAVGAGIYRSPTVGWLFWGCQSLLSLLALLLLGIRDGREAIPADTRSGAMPPLTKRFFDAVRDATYGFLQVGGWILFFSVFVGVCERALAEMGVGALPRALVCGFCELSGGVLSVGALSLSWQVKTFLLALVTSWSGICVAMQIGTFVLPAELSVKRYFAVRLLLSPLIAVCTTGAVFFCGSC